MWVEGHSVWNHNTWTLSRTGEYIGDNQTVVLNKAVDYRLLSQKLSLLLLLLERPFTVTLEESHKQQNPL